MSSINAIVSFDELKATMRASSKAELVALLETQGIKYTLGKGGRPFTTLRLIECAATKIPPTSFDTDDEALQPQTVRLIKNASS